MKNSKKSSQIKPSQLKILDPRCAGIDIGASELFVCIAELLHKIFNCHCFCSGAGCRASRLNMALFIPMSLWFLVSLFFY